MTTFTLEALENYDATRAAQADGAGFPTQTGVDTHNLGLSADPVRRKLWYGVLIEYPSVTNDTGFTLWTGESSIAPAALLSSGNLSLWLGEKDLDTGAVTFHDVYDSAETVPVGIGGGDGTWRRSVFDITRTMNLPVVVDPRTGNVWLQTDSCEVHCFRLEDSYKMTISPCFATVSLLNQQWPVAMNDDWVVLYEQSGVGVTNLTPRLRTAEEISADELLVYAAWTWPIDPSQLYWALATDANGDVWAFAWGVQHGSDFQLWKFTMPTSAPYGGPVVGGGWTDETPWGPATGPNALTADYDLSLDLAQERVVAYWSDDRRYLHAFIGLLYTEYVPDPTDVDAAKILHVVYDTQTAAYTSEVWLQGYLDAALAHVADPADAVYVITGQVWGTNAFAEFDSYHAIPASRWLFAAIHPVAAGVPGSRNSCLIIEAGLSGTSTPTIEQVFYDATSWTAAYPAYAANVLLDWGDYDVVRANLPTGPLFFMQGVDNGFFDADTNSFYWSANQTSEITTAATPGSQSALYMFDADFSGREAVEDADPPILRLSFAPMPAGDGGRVWVTRYKRRRAVA